MSKLQNMEHIFCTSCNARMQEILLCVNCRRRVDDDGLPILIRCNYLVCNIVNIARVVVIDIITSKKN